MRSSHNTAKTHCPQGHPYDEANTIVYTWKRKGWTSRQCRACMRARNKPGYIPARPQRRRLALLERAALRWFEVTNGDGKAISIKATSPDNAIVRRLAEVVAAAQLDQAQKHRQRGLVPWTALPVGAAEASEAVVSVNDLYGEGA